MKVIERSFSDIFVGLEQSFYVNIDNKKLAQFLDLSGDINPLHTNKGYARSKGFEGVVVNGLLTSSFYATLVGSCIVGSNCLIQSINVKYVKMYELLHF